MLLIDILKEKIVDKLVKIKRERRNIENYITNIKIYQKYITESLANIETTLAEKKSFVDELEKLRSM